jgi:hypothetical protein
MAHSAAAEYGCSGDINSLNSSTVLADRLHADITIGIDIKNNTCGLLVVLKGDRFDDGTV